MSDLWAITANFNPCHYRTRLANFRTFRERLGVPLVAVELFYGGRAELEPADADILVRIPGKDVLWQKERLLNVALGVLPDACEAVAWVDCDIVFAAAGWDRRVLEALESAPVIQPFGTVYDLPRGAACSARTASTTRSSWAAATRRWPARPSGCLATPPAPTG